MIRSLFSGVSGLNNHQTRMDEIGHNISNVNTHGYKRGRVTFQEIFSQRLSGAARPTDERGGINPKQVGLGMQIAAIDTIHTQGSLQTTGVNTDVAMVGRGFFINRADQQYLYTRAGAFSLDAEGSLVNQATGYRVQGYPSITNADGTTVINKSATMEDLVVPIGQKLPAHATELVNYRSNLNLLTPAIPVNASPGQVAEGTWTSTLKVYDSRGDIQQLQLQFQKNIDLLTQTELENEWLVSVSVSDAAGNLAPNVIAASTPADITNTFILRFDTAGAIQSILDPNDLATPIGVTGDDINVALSYTIPGSDPSVIQLNLGTSGLYDGITQFASPSTTKAYFQDGYALGYLENFNINDEGIIVGNFTNGIRQDIGQLAVATFNNPGGLERSGETYFSETNNSGLALVGQASSLGAGKIRSGTLELSNVDLAEEFTNMIITQRGFQANSRVITTSDTMLEEVLRLKR